jgi:hypothetical protein
MVLTGGVEEQAAIYDSLHYIRLPETPNHYILTMKMANAVSAKILDNFQH